MKRTGALLRRTPLKQSDKPLRRTELARGSSTLDRRTPLNPISDKRKRDNVERRKVVSAMRAIAKGECARCGRRDVVVHGHEKLARSHGGDIINPTALLDDVCNGWCEDNPQIAAWTGWKLSTKWPHDPALEPWEARRLDGVSVDLRALYAVEYEDIA